MEKVSVSTSIKFGWKKPWSAHDNGTYDFEISASVGYSDQSYFTKVFKKQTGISRAGFGDKTCGRYGNHDWTSHKQA